MDKKLGKYAFIAAAILAVIVGIVSGYLSSQTAAPESLSYYQNALQWLISVMVILGIAVGFLNISAKEKKDFLFAGTVFIVAAVGGAADVFGGILANLAGTNADILALGKYMRGIFQAMLAVVIPAVVIVSAKMIWDASKDR